MATASETLVSLRDHGGRRRVEVPVWCLPQPHSGRLPRSLLRLIDKGFVEPGVASVDEPPGRPAVLALARITTGGVTYRLSETGLAAAERLH
jgi:hypothetical protein